MLVINKPKFRESDPHTMKFLISGSIVTRKIVTKIRLMRMRSIYFFFYANIFVAEENSEQENSEDNDLQEDFLGLSPDDDSYYFMNLTTS
jgi:hypothetical protein